jgi:Holliday junction resolvasome RuvABC DNA-binding subunit
LEDPREELTDEELANVLQLSSMGFNEARTARAYKRLNKDQAKVLDFLFLVGQLEELGYKGNSAETALIACDSKVEGVSTLT